MSDRSRLLTNLGVVLGVGFFVALVVWGPLTGARPSAAPTPTPAPTEEPPTLAPAPPERLVIPALEVDTEVVDVVVGADLALRPPRSPDRVGWWSGSAPPGAERGATVLAGHTVHTGGGALDDLGRLRAGDTLRVTTASGVMMYRIERVTTYGKSDLAARAARLFDQRGRPRLVVVTCADWDGTAYRANVVAVARPVEARAAGVRV